MNIRYYRDPETGLPHITNHGISEREVREVFRNSSEDLPGRDDSREKVGQTDAGRVLKIFYKRDPIPDSVFVITGYDLRGKARRAYNRRRKKRR